MPENFIESLEAMNDPSSRILDMTSGSLEQFPVAFPDLFDYESYNVGVKG